MMLDAWIPLVMVVLTLAIHALFVSSGQRWFGRAAVATMVAYAVLAILGMPKPVWAVPLVLSCALMALGTWLDLQSRRRGGM